MGAFSPFPCMSSIVPYMLRTVQTNKEVFCVVDDYVVKSYLSKGY